MATYRFVGSKMSIGDAELVSVGQSIELDQVDPLWPLVTNAQFEAAKFEPEHLKKFAHHNARHLAPAEFMEKLKGLWKLVGTPDAPKTEKGSK
jgi:hypothetical protein